MTALVDWDENSSDSASRYSVHGGLFGRPGAITPTDALLTPGAPDISALNDYQLNLLRAIRDGIVIPLRTEDGYRASFLNRPVPQRSFDILIENRLIEPAPSKIMEAGFTR
jgi:hypothetical protein